MISVLGPVQVLHDGQPVDIGSPRHREVLAALVVDAGRVVSTDALLERVWGEGARGADDGQPARRHLPAARAVARGRRARRDRDRPPGYRLDAAGRRGRAPASSRAAPAPARPSRRETSPEARRALDRGARAVARRGVRRHRPPLRGGRGRAARRPAARPPTSSPRRSTSPSAATRTCCEQLPTLVAEHPLRETFRRQLMLALFRAGRQAEALDVYADVRAVLVDELGVDPGPELQALHQRILEQDPGPARHRAHAGPRRRPAPARVAREWHSEVVVPPNALLGREREVEYLVGLLADATQRLVTVTGVGGVGKTRLAYAVASAARDHFRDGVAIVSLAPLADPAMVLPAIGRATGLSAVEGLGPGCRGDRPPAHPRGAAGARQRRAPAGRRRRAEPAGGLLPGRDRAGHQPDARSACAVSCSTSSRRSRSPTRRRPTPAALAGSAAVALFVERARDARRRPSSSTTRNAAAVGAICRRLSGIPLALELAAARSRLLTPAAMLARLDEVMAAAGARDLPPRQRTMRAALDWSYQLLDARRAAAVPDAVGVQRRLHPRGRGGGGGARRGCSRALDGLVEHSLVQLDRDHPEATRFRMLEPVLQFAGSLLGPRRPSRRPAARTCATSWPSPRRPSRATAARAPSRRSRSPSASTPTWSRRSSGVCATARASCPAGWGGRCGCSGGCAATCWRAAG